MATGAVAVNRSNQASLLALAAEVDEIVQDWEGAKLRLRYPADWEDLSSADVVT